MAIVANSFGEASEGSSSNTSAIENQAAKFAYFSQGNSSSDSAQDIASQSSQSVAQGMVQRDLERDRNAITAKT